LWVNGSKVTSFGGGSGWSGGLLNASVQIGSGYTLSAPQITASTGFNGIGSQITNINAANISTGTLSIVNGGTNNGSYTVSKFIIYKDGKLRSSES